MKLLYRPQDPLWPVLDVFCEHLDADFALFSAEEDLDILWRIIGRPKPRESYEAWHWWIFVLSGLKDYEDQFNWYLLSGAEMSNPHLSSNASKLLGLTLQGLFEILSKKFRVRPESMDRHSQNCVLIAIFAVISAASSAVEIILYHSCADETLSPRNSPRSALRLASALNLPLVDVIRALTKATRADTDGYLALTSSSTHYADAEAALESGVMQRIHNNLEHCEGILHESIVNFDSLWRVSRLKVKWVYTINEHLSWDPDHCTVCIFSYPIICMVNSTKHGRLMQR